MTSTLSATNLADHGPTGRARASTFHPGIRDERRRAVDRHPKDPPHADPGGFLREPDVRRRDRYRTSLPRVLDTLGGAVQACDATGRSLHRTPALIEMLERDPESDRLECTLRIAVEALSDAPGRVHGPPPCAGSVETAFAKYAWRTCLYEAEASGSGHLILVTLERLTVVPRSRAELSQIYGLTTAEAGVAELLAAGMGNAEIASRLLISPHTARRHTERVLGKLGIHSRAEVAARVLR